MSSELTPALDYPFSATVRVRTYELDSFGHVNNSVYLNYMEEARSEYLKQLGLSFHDFARLGVQIVIVESHLRYLSPARYGDTLEVRGRLRDVKAASLVFDYRLLRVGTLDVVADGWTRGAFVAASTGRPTRAPLEFARAFASLSGKEEDRRAE